jgi:U3 small nucleolar RNA-associated protein 16
MFANLVTAAKGLFTRQPEEQESQSAGTSANSKMVTATRRADVAPEIANGKRKAQSASASKSEDQQTKRRRRSDPKATGTDQEAVKHTPAEKSSVNAEKAPAGKKIRFDSEEPEPLETQPEEISETPTQDDDDEDDSDDDAPETINNSAQLLKMKEQAKKQEAAKQLYGFLTFSEVSFD